MTRRRWFWLGGAALLAVAAAAAVFWATAQPGWAWRATYQQIQLGMTADQVEAVMGRPPGDYSTGPVNLAGGSYREGATDLILAQGATRQADRVQLWYDDHACLAVQYDDAGRTNGKFLQFSVNNSAVWRIIRWLMSW